MEGMSLRNGGVTVNPDEDTVPDFANSQEIIVATTHHGQIHAADCRKLKAMLNCRKSWEVLSGNMKETYLRDPVTCRRSMLPDNMFPNTLVLLQCVTDPNISFLRFPKPSCPTVPAM